MRVEFVNEDERVVGAGEMPHAPRIGEKVRLLRPEQDGGSGQGELFEVVDVYYWVPNQQQTMGEERLFSFTCELVDVYVRPIAADGLPRTERFAVGADEMGR
jgi:hypothetical protein